MRHRSSEARDPVRADRSAGFTPPAQTLVVRTGAVKRSSPYGGAMTGAEHDAEDEFPPRRPFGLPARPAPPDPDEDDATGAPPRPGGSGAARGQPPAPPFYPPTASRASAAQLKRSPPRRRPASPICSARAGSASTAFTAAAKSD